MSAIRVILGCLFLAVCGLIAWTQYLAYHYGYHSTLGPSLWTAQHFYHRYSVYWPWQAVVWQWRWGGLWWQVGMIGGAVGTVAICLGSGWLVRQQRHGQPPEMTGHGSTQWATTGDVRKAGLL